MLGQPVESNTVKFFPYWPDAADGGARITKRFVVDNVVPADGVDRSDCGDYRKYAASLHARRIALPDAFVGGAHFVLTIVCRVLIG